MQLTNHEVPDEVIENLMNDIAEFFKQPLEANALFAWLISHQPAVLFSHNKTATSNQPAVLFSQNKSAPAISHQPTEQAESLLERGIPLCLASQSPHVYQCSPHAGQTQAR
jgi:hypothetical protein